MRSDRWRTSISHGMGPGRVRDAINFHLKPVPCAVLDCMEATPAFDARFSASARHYVYRILTRRARPVLDRDRVWWLTHLLDVEAMRDGAIHLVGRHDFTTFRATNARRNRLFATLDRLDVTREGAEIVIRASARSFLHNQVRSMVGTLKLVGEGKWAAAGRCGCLVRAGPDAVWHRRAGQWALSGAGRLSHRTLTQVRTSMWLPACVLVTKKPFGIACCTRGTCEIRPTERDAPTMFCSV